MEKFDCVRVIALDPQKNFESRGARRRNSHCKLLSQMIAGFEAVAVDEFRRGHAALALELEVAHEYRATVGAHEQALRIGAQHFAGGIGSGIAQGRTGEDLELARAGGCRASRSCA